MQKTLDDRRWLEGMAKEANQELEGARQELVGLKADRAGVNPTPKF